LLVPYRSWWRRYWSSGRNCST